MKKQVLFLQGGGGGEDYAADAKLVASLQTCLGGNYEIHYPLLHDEATPDFGRINQIGKAFASIKGDVILVAHSLGGSMLLKYLSEIEVKQEIGGVFLIAIPFWAGGEDWKKGLKLQPDFADKIPLDLPIFLYHCMDDDVVPFEHLEIYKRHLPQATVRELGVGGHQLNDDLSIVARDILSFASKEEQDRVDGENL